MNERHVQLYANVVITPTRVYVLLLIPIYVIMCNDNNKCDVICNL